MRRIFLFCYIICLLFISCQRQEIVRANPINTIGGRSIEQQTLDDFLLQLMDSSTMPGLSIALIDKGEISYQNQFGVINKESQEAVNKQTLFEAASLSKPVFAYFVLKQVDKALLDLDYPLFNYLEFPELESDNRYKKITARMILSHTSGLPNWRQGELLSLLFDPGEHYSYSGEGYQYLARVIAELNGITTAELDELFQKEVAGPLAIDRLYFDWNNDIALNKSRGHINGIPTNSDTRFESYWESDRFGAAGGLHTDASSYAKFMIALMNRQGLSENSFNEFFKEQVSLSPQEIDVQLIGASGWSLGLGMAPTANGMSYYHGGNNGDFQSWFFIHPDKKYGLVYFTNYDQSQTTYFFPELIQTLDEDIVFNYDLWKKATGN